MDSIVHGILQARILEWVTFPFSGVSSQPRDWTQVSQTAGRFSTSWATREAQGMLLNRVYKNGCDDNFHVIYFLNHNLKIKETENF